MPFAPTTWQDSPSTATPITAAQLNRMEAGIVEGVRAASETQTGNVELATATEMTTGTDLSKVPSVKRVVDYIAQQVGVSGGVTLAQLNAAVSAPMSFISTAIGMIPLTLKAVAGQTADIFQVKNESDVVIAYIDSNGQITAGGTFSGQGMLKAKARSSSTPVMRLQTATSQSGQAMILEDATGQNKFTVLPDGTVNGANIGNMPGTGIQYSPLIILDAATPVPSSTIAGTVVLRRPA